MSGCLGGRLKEGPSYGKSQIWLCLRICAPNCSSLTRASPLVSVIPITEGTFRRMPDRCPLTATSIRPRGCPLHSHFAGVTPLDTFAGNQHAFNKHRLFSACIMSSFSRSRALNLTGVGIFVSEHALRLARWLYSRERIPRIRLDNKLSLWRRIGLPEAAYLKAADGQPSLFSLWVEMAGHCMGQLRSF